MKILIINTVRFRLNGITSVIMNYYRNMQKEDLQIDFVVINKISGEYRQELEGNNAKIYCLNRKKNPIQYIVNLIKLFSKNNYDIVHIHGNSAMMLPEVWSAKKARVPVRIVHSHSTNCSHRILHKMLYPVFDRLYTHGFACGQDAGKWLFHNKYFVEIKNGIVLEKYKYNQESRLEYREKIQAGNRTVIGHAGNFVDQKNHIFLIDVFARLVEKNPDYLLLLISDGYLIEQIKKKVHTLRLDSNVIFLGKTTEVQQYLQAMDIFVLPSFSEGFPVVLVEAQVAGLPCLVSDTITKEVDLTKSLKFISIESIDTWVEEIEQKFNLLSQRNRSQISAQWQKQIWDCGYDIKENAVLLKKLYLEYSNENGRMVNNVN